MINFDDSTNENIIEHNSKWPYNTYCTWFEIRKNKCIIEFNKQSAGH